MKIRKYLLLLIIPLLFASCFEDMDDKISNASTLEIQNFIYRGLNFFYLYKEDVPKLADDAFGSDEERNNFLKSFDSPESLFDNLIAPQDRFSRLFDDYIAIENALSGVSMSNGMEYGLVYYPDNRDKIFGYVRYILPNSDAASKDLKRGDLFTTVDGVQLTPENYGALLASENYSIGLATYDGNQFTLTGESVALTKYEYDENPVFLSKTLDIQGQKIGYIMYTGFTRRYDVELNNAFAQFKADGVTDLVVDLRYNGGGSVETAVDLSSMITGQFNGQLLYKELWNSDRQGEYARDGKFDDKISTGASINSLNIDRVYFLTTKSSASASELVINCLNPYINTVQIGDATAGKFQASFLLYDAPDFSRQRASTSHTYAMLPLVFKIANKNGNTDFMDGLSPNIELRENFFNLGTLGEPDEPLLAAALNQIGVSPRYIPEAFDLLEEVGGSEMESPLHGIMVQEIDSQ